MFPRPLTRPPLAMTDAAVLGPRGPCGWSEGSPLSLARLSERAVLTSDAHRNGAEERGRAGGSRGCRGQLPADSAVLTCLTDSVSLLPAALRSAGNERHKPSGGSAKLLRRVLMQAFPQAVICGSFRSQDDRSDEMWPPRSRLTHQRTDPRQPGVAPAQGLAGLGFGCCLLPGRCSLP